MTSGDMKMSNRDCQFASIRSWTNNVGDDVQNLAAERFLPRIDALAQKDRLSQFQPNQKTKLIMNGWWTYRPRRLVPGPNVDPLLVSMHFCKGCHQEVANGRIRDFLLKHGPVGCRDEATRKFLEGVGIPAYFSGCLTLTLQRNPAIEPNGYVVCVGLNDDLYKVVKKRTSRKTMSIQRYVPMLYSQDTRMDIARAFLALYQGAHCVVTRMLHVALPCLALGTPCLFVDLNPARPENQMSRFEGLSDLLNHVSVFDFLNGKFDFDFDSPPSPIGGSKFEMLRDELVRRCSEFTGYDRNESMLSTTDPLPFFLEVLSRPEYYAANSWRMLYPNSVWKMPLHRITTALWNRCIRGWETFDL